MRMKRKRLREMFLRPRISSKDSEGHVLTSYGEAIRLIGEEWPAGGKVQTQLYGNRLPYIRNVRIEGNYERVVEDNGQLVYRYSTFDLREGDGICIDCTGDRGPDYRIIAVASHCPLRMEVERL